MNQSFNDVDLSYDNLANILNSSIRHNKSKNSRIKLEMGQLDPDINDIQFSRYDEQTNDQLPLLKSKNSILLEENSSTSTSSYLLIAVRLSIIIIFTCIFFLLKIIPFLRGVTYPITKEQCILDIGASFFTQLNQSGRLHQGLGNLMIIVSSLFIDLYFLAMSFSW